MTTHLDNARDAVAAAIAQADALDELYSSPDRVPPHLVANAHDKLRRAIKLAEVHALLHIGDQLAALARRPDAVVDDFADWAAVNEIAAPPLDWAGFGAIVRRHAPDRVS